MTIGIDMSKNSPGVCIQDGESFRFLSFIRGKNKGKISEHYASLMKKNVEIYFYEKTQPPKQEYSESEVWKANDAMEYANWIVSHLPDNVSAIGIEGFSYGSSGNAFIDIVGYGYAIRTEILRKYGKDKLKVFSPGNVKKKAGKGNANKEKMMEFFLELESEVCKTMFWKGLKDGTIDKTKKPVDDLCDAFYILQCLNKEEI